MATTDFVEKLDTTLAASVINFDSVIVHGLWQYHGLAVRRACLKNKVPYVVFAHGMLDPWFASHYPFKHLKKSLYWLLFEHRTLSSADSLIFTCEQERILARQSFRPYKCKESVVTYGAQSPNEGLKELRESFFIQYPMLRKKRIVLFLGRLHEKKGGDLLLNSFANIASKHSDAHLVYVGPDGGIKNSLEKRTSELGLNERVTFLGALHGNAKWPCYAAAEVFALPSHQENFGITVAESLSCSTPVLISNKVNIWEEVVAANAGIAAEDTQEGCDILLSSWFALSESQRDTYRDAAEPCYLEHFSPSIATESLLNAIEQILSKRKKL